jgi:rfaE bifunctional protein kinase chain/domain
MNAQDMLALMEGHKVLVIGDVMLDRYLTGQVTRISPEAPVPVVLQEDTEDRLGGAANVALNLRALGAQPILCSVIGGDSDGEFMRRLLPTLGIRNDGIVESASRRTTVKTRILGNGQQMLRVDQENTYELDLVETQRLLGCVEELIETEDIRAIIFQDYNKGVLTETVVRSVLEMIGDRDILTMVDPKKSNFYVYEGVDVFKPNLKEVRDSVPFSVRTTLDSLNQADAYLRQKLNHQITMITLSEKGIYLNDGINSRIFPTAERLVADVSGAGDTVISIATLAFVAGFSPEWTAVLCNLAGGQVCEFRGVAPVRVDLLHRDMEIWLRAGENG